MKERISRDTPLQEITLRRYEKLFEVSKRELVKRLCLSIGVLQPGDSRDVIVDVLYVLLDAKKRNEELSSVEVETRVIGLRESEKLPQSGIAPSNIRRQIKRLRDIFLVEKIKNKYRITEFMGLTEIFNSKIERFLIENIVMRIKQYLKEIDEVF